MFTLDNIIAVAAALVGTLGFGILFNIRGKKLVFTALGGMIAWFFYLALYHALQNEILCYFIVSIFMSLYGEVLARILKTPATTFVITTLIPLVPGGSLYYAIDFAVTGNWESFIGKAGYTLGLAAALSVGIILVHAISRHSKWHLPAQKDEK